MYISRIALDMFRSWQHLVLDCNQGITVFYGHNGLGKTNILEAIEVISTGASHRTSAMAPLIFQGSQDATVRVNVADDDNTQSLTTYELTLHTRGAHRARINGGKSLYMRDIVGKIPVVTFTPRDQFFILGDPSLRRGFLDQAAALIIPHYWTMLQDFRHIAKQRAALLKTLRDAQASEYHATLAGLEIWTGRFIDIGMRITRARQTVINLLTPHYERIVCDLTDQRQHAGLCYEASLMPAIMKSDDQTVHSLISEHFQQLYAGEVSRGMNLIGPQRDDVTCLLDDNDARDFASSGEAWTLCLALKMALFEVLAAQYGIKPILLLDDVFAQLDEKRRYQILQFSQAQQQVFITTASLHDIPQEAIATAQLIDVDTLSVQKYGDQDDLILFDNEHHDKIQNIVAQRMRSNSDDS